ncbi:glutamine amidotransferase [Parvibaculum sp.]|uniref:glutamine amidotransferase n=1 Tax=Parvibaculum sp. TaxID=2024848 RepID=UPI003919CC68
MGRRILFVLHQERSSPGRVGQALIRRGCELDIRRPALGDPLPADMAGHDAAVIFGGPMSANDELAFIKAETEWIGIPLKEEKPFLGICLGGQMMARHLGARVYSHPQERVEAGYYPIRPTADGRHLFDDPQHVYQWHRQGFDLPSGAVQLAEGGDFPVQAMRYGKAAYGLQFHPELTTPMMDAWLEFGKERLNRPGAQPAELHRQGRAEHDATLRAWLERFFDHWLPAEAEKD